MALAKALALPELGVGEWPGIGAKVRLSEEAGQDRVYFVSLSRTPSRPGSAFLVVLNPCGSLIKIIKGL